MGAVTVFIAVALAGGAFLLYFLYALLREEYRASKRTRLKITKLPSRRPQTVKLLRLTLAKEMRERKRF